MEIVKVYLKAKENLEALAQNQGVDITKYYVPTHTKKYGNGINYFFYLFCGHLADRQYMGNIIKFYHKNSDTQKIMETILFNYDPKKTINAYNNEENLIQEIKKRYPDKIKNTEKWNEYLTGICECARFLTDGNINGQKISFDDLLNEPKTEDEIKIYLYKLRLIINNITGVGVAVCYNWLKECGAVWLAKPDLHIKRVVAKLLIKEMGIQTFDIDNADKIIDEYRKDNKSAISFPSVKWINKNSKLYADEFVAVYMWKWAQEIRNNSDDNRCTAYKLDRILYLYCTNGHFYLDDDNDISEDGLLGMIDE